MRIFKFRKSYRNCTSCKTASARQAGDFLIVRTKRNSRKEHIHFSVFNFKDPVECLLREPQEKAALSALLFPPLFPRAFYTFPNNDEYRNPGRHIRHNHGSNKSRIHRKCLSIQKAFFFSETNCASKTSQRKPSFILLGIIFIHYTRMLYCHSLIWKNMAAFRF